MKHTMTPETIGCIVTQGGLPCTLRNTALTMRGGVLLPRQHGEQVVFFGTRRDARRAIKRTERIIGKLKGTLLDGWERLLPFLSGQPYEIIPVMRSHVVAQTAKSADGEAAHSKIRNPKSREVQP